jgi:hypothetical protein
MYMLVVGFERAIWFQVVADSTLVRKTVIVVCCHFSNNLQNSNTSNMQKSIFFY